MIDTQTKIEMKFMKVIIKILAPIISLLYGLGVFGDISLTDLLASLIGGSEEDPADEETPAGE